MRCPFSKIVFLFLPLSFITLSTPLPPLLSHSSLSFLPFRNSIAASAVCAFNLSAISQVFNGPFKYQENSRSAWLPYPNPNPDFQVTTRVMEEWFLLNRTQSVCVCCDYNFSFCIFKEHVFKICTYCLHQTLMVMVKTYFHHEMLYLYVLMF